MTNEEFAKAVAHHTRVLNQIREVLDENEMDLQIDTDDMQICLIDNGRDIGYTGFNLP